ncbi:hypothetical protein BJY01DRAFT_256360 [Aspergillus pseudoustus]|uniref:Uncharacterized protein n=1 Tax=Aspergillus pseudoustus TaxID=1810923 RepID=A0ABR4IBG2_9EURO
MAYCPDHIRQIHEDFAFEIRRNMKAVVEICWGAHVRKRMLEEVSLVPLPLWGEYKDITLFLEFLDNQDTTKITRFVMFVYHPGFFFYRLGNTESSRNWRNRFGREQDRLLAVAAKLGGIAIREGFYEYTHNPATYGRLSTLQLDVKEKMIAQALEELRIAVPEAFLRMEERKYKPFERQVDEHIKEISPMVQSASARAASLQSDVSEGPFYNADIRKIKNSLIDVENAVTNECSLSQAISIDLAIEFSELTSISEFDYLPEPLVSWLQAQAGLKIDGKAIDTIDELVLCFKLLHRFQETQVPSSAIEIAYAIALAYVSNVSKAKKSSICDLIVPATELQSRVMPLKCRKCEKRVLDNCFPFFSLNDTTFLRLPNTRGWMWA